MAFDQLVEDHHKLSFRNNFMLATQRLGPKLRRFVTEQRVAGEGASIADIIDPVKYRRGEGRRRDNIENVPNRRRRWLVYREPLETGQYIDSVDKFKMIDDPTSRLMEAHSAAIGRGVDDVILGLDEDGKVSEGGLLGPVVEGKRPGGAATALPTANIIPAGGTGLTIAKMRAARKALGLAEHDLDRVQIVMAITTNQADNLLGIVETGSANLNQLEQPQLVDGKVSRLMGFNFVEINRLPLVGNVRSCPVWLPDNLVLGVWQDIRPDMWNDSHARNTPYIHVDAYMDATRIEDTAVRIVECVET